MSFSMRGVSTHDDWETGTSPSKIPSSSEVVIESTLTNSDAWVLQDDSTYSLIFNIDMETNFARGNGGAIQDAPLKRFSWAADWKGKLGFWLSTSITSSTLYAPTITSWTIPFETGHGVLTEKGRNLIDDKTGLPTYASEMMEDGFHRGRWTTANAWDPDDPRNLRTIKPSKTEGKIVDKVPLTGSGN
ncbi:MAG: hypothetical protein GY737_00295 [Desulfobacteraceae bacterium]|nr:hypothetical protein [Desulfobacteraceae bacterium]